MRILVNLGLGIALAVGTSADVQIFFMNSNPSPWLGAGPANAFAPTGGHGQDYSHDGYVPDYAHFPSAMSNIAALAGEPIYIWMKYTADNGTPPPGAHLQGVELALKDQNGQMFDPNAPGNDLAYYVCENDDPSNKRWDGDITPPEYDELKQNPQVLVAVTATGIRNVAVDHPENLYSGALRTALLGVVRFSEYGVYQFELGELGISFNTGATPTALFGTVAVVPEPAALAILALVCLSRRRRFVCAG